eukprot:8785994-Lingulodinium_polyedra.AAC.1
MLPPQGIVAIRNQTLRPHGPPLQPSRLARWERLAPGTGNRWRCRLRSDRCNRGNCPATGH